MPKGRATSEMAHGVPVTYVPARNTIFLSFALAYAEVLGSSDIYIGVNAIDYSGYARRAIIRRANDAIWRESCSRSQLVIRMREGRSRMTTILRRQALSLALALGVTVLGGAAPVLAQDATPAAGPPMEMPPPPEWAEVVATGLANPRGMAFGADGALYIAEAGIGGEGPCAMGPEGNEECFGESGGVTRILDGAQERVLDGLASRAAAGGAYDRSAASRAHGPGLDAQELRARTRNSRRPGSARA